MNTMEILFARNNMRCVLCDTLSSAGCTCWEKCSCGWSAQRGFQCNNPATTKCSTKLKYKRQATVEEYYAAGAIGAKAARKRKRLERKAAKQLPQEER